MRKGKYVNLVHGLGVFVAMMVLMKRCEATTFTVGGSKGWTVPSDNAPVYNQWAERMRFQVGDSLPGSDSVLRVTKEDYTNCNTNAPLEKYTDGHTEFKFNQSGPHYFISGNKDNCLKHEMLVVVVLSDRSKKNSSATQSPPSPPPSPTPAPAPAPSTPSLPPATTAAAPAPSTEAPPPPSGAPSLFALRSFVGSLGAFVGSSLFFLAF
ncbi:hypothetical protein Cgig2_029682 [Carnegiea gigantea]|uniref:Phytocyanin domain-containing protein n=1 Tax=Carnegiea gigantea TaxID=171969 RepID=A0A9Q1KJE1_9CARY|nr:hypothetical protein Cgig2_029682 [Carnegiea gigantea]